jgi:hypothetical protein
MKIISLFFTFFFSIYGNAQVNSYYFAAPVPGEKVERVHSTLYGNYEDGKGRIYSFSDSGIYLLSTTVCSISRELIRESAQYRVENGFLFGVLPVDSIPCIEEGDNYFFGIRNRDVLIGKGSSHVLIRDQSSTNTYYLNYAENGIYNLNRFYFNKGKLEISSLEYEVESTVFDAIKDQKSVSDGSINLILLKPSSEEFEALLKSGIFGLPQFYSRIK